MSRFRRRLMGLAALRQAKADDYVRVEYIENTSNAYINTGLICNSNYQFYIDVLLKTLDRTNFIFGGRRKNNVIDSNSNYSMGLYVNANNNFGSMMVRSSSVYTDYTVEADKRYTISGDPNALTISYMGIDEETQEEIEQSFVLSIGGAVTTYGQPLYIFNTYQPTINANNALIGRIYKFQIKNASGTLIRDYIPMYQVSTDTYGLWDRVNEEFYTSPNGVKFTGGERVIADANDNLYYFRNYIVTANNTKVCSIGIQPNATDTFEAKIYFPSTGRNYAFGAWSSNNNNAYGLIAISSTLRFQYHSGTINYSGTYSQRTFTFKEIFDDETQTMHFYIFDANGKQIFHNSVGKRGGTSSRAMLIGDFNGSSYGSVSGTRFYYFKYKRNQELIRDMIPVQSVETGEYGLLDKVNLKIYYSTGGTPFTGA